MARSRGESSDGKSISQKEMVRLSLEELGTNAKPQELHDQIKTKFNKDLPTTIISNYKSVLKREGGASTSSPSGRGRRGGGAGSIQIDDLETVRGLVHRLGGEQVRKLVEMFS